MGVKRIRMSLYIITKGIVITTGSCIHVDTIIQDDDIG
jgi:hypothetical protein